MARSSRSSPWPWFLSSSLRKTQSYPYQNWKPCSLVSPHVLTPDRKGKIWIQVPGLWPNGMRLLMVFPPLIFIALSVVSLLYKYSDFSVPEVLVATNHFKMVLPVFSETCSPFLTIPSTGFVGRMEQCMLCMNCPWMLGSTSHPLNQPKVPCQALESTSRHPKYTSPQVALWFSQKSPVYIHYMQRIESKQV